MSQKYRQSMNQGNLDEHKSYADERKIQENFRSYPRCFESQDLDATTEVQ